MFKGHSDTPFIDQDIPTAVDVDESVWTVESSKDKQRTLQVCLEKKDQKWWDCFLEGDAKIAKPQVGNTNESPNAFMQKFLENEEKAKERKKAEDAL